MPGSKKEKGLTEDLLSGKTKKDYDELESGTPGSPSDTEAGGQYQSMGEGPSSAPPVAKKTTLGSIWSGLFNRSSASAAPVQKAPVKTGLKEGLLSEGERGEERADNDARGTYKPPQ